MTPLTPLQHRMRIWVLSSWSALIVLVFWHQLMQSLSLQQIGWAVLFSLPLFAPLPGLWQGRRYTHSWATLCVLPYFIIGISESVANPALRDWALSLLGCSLLWFFALLGFLRVSPSKPARDESAA